MNQVFTRLTGSNDIKVHLITFILLSIFIVSLAAFIFNALTIGLKSF